MTKSDMAKNRWNQGLNSVVQLQGLAVDLTAVFLTLRTQSFKKFSKYIQYMTSYYLHYYHLRPCHLVLCLNCSICPYLFLLSLSSLTACHPGFLEIHQCARNVSILGQLLQLFPLHAMISARYPFANTFTTSGHSSNITSQ